ncbi:hypothetical protein HOC54_01645 [Candidatus Peregrinibacteria bacterium]|jgi:hypothetical protein|nr:hypothetical protein [Candidatus Peregrinibacteria bacterium]
MQRILIKNKKSQIFRICSFGFFKDHKEEEYIKFSFPDLKKVKNLQSEKDYIMEFSTHFHEGVSHFKTLDQERVHRNESKSKFKNAEFIHLLTYMIYDLNHFKEFLKKASLIDYHLENIFDPKKGKVFEFYLSKFDEKITLPAKNYSDLTWCQYQAFASKNKEYRMLMVEYDYKEIPNKTGVSLFRKHDQKEDCIKIKLPK